MKYKILHGTINGKHFTTAIYDQEEITGPLDLGLKRFFKVYENLEFKKKIKKESDQGYFVIDSRRA